MYDVRAANPLEINTLAAMGERLHKDSAYAHMDYDEMQFRGVLWAAMEGERGLFLRVILERTTRVPVGFLIAEVTGTFFGKDKIAHDILLLVEGEHRGKCGFALVRMVDEYRTWAIEKGAKRTFLATSTGIEPEVTEKLFESLGFHKIGTIHEA